jgi:hypothetical protein
MKVAIFTLPLRNNYGGLLQAYALQVALEQLGFDASIIRHHGLRARSLRQKLSNWIPGFVPVRLNNGKRCLLRTRRKAHDKISQNMRDFVADNMKQTNKLYVIEDLVELNTAGYDALIVGSDQIWRPAYTGNIRACFFDFIDNKNIKKIAYAASFGASDWELSDQETADCAQLVELFSGVSVRENNAVTWCQEKLKTEAKLVVDPTILLGAAHYKRFVSRPMETAYLCAYILDPAPRISASIDTYAEQRGISRINPMPECEYADVGEAGLDRCIYPLMSDWLSAFYYSDVVITDSFHGTVFAVMFNKPFLTVLNKRRGSPRFESFLGELGLLSRLVNRLEDIDETIEALPEIDWSSVNRRLENWRRSSVGFLESKLQDGVQSSDLK